ncbi:MAG: endolytic transglycosylase MltG, partial [Bacteroidales bacterium]|nr:endolytic transglycosylase MltG [Bacteroidales bacterium]
MKRLLLLVLYVGVIVAVLVGITLYKSLFKPVKVGEEGIEIIIPINSEYEDVKSLLESANLVVNEKSFDLLAKRKNYRDNIKAGRYIITNEMSNNDIVNLLRSGNQTPVKLVFNNIRTLSDLASRVSTQLAVDSLDFLDFIQDENYYKKDGFNYETIMAVFVPDT